MVDAKLAAEPKKRHRSRTLTISEEEAAAARSQKLRDKRKAAGWVYVETMVPSREDADILYAMAAKMRAGEKDKEDREREEKRNKIKGIIDEIRVSVSDSFSGIAAELNRRGVPPLRRGRWHARQVQRILEEASAPTVTGRKS
jgi:hypothetical protein